MVDLAVNLSLHTNTSYADALMLSEYDIEPVFESKAFKDKIKSKETDYKLMESITKRLDALIKKPILKM